MLCIVPFHTHKHGHGWDVTKDEDEERTKGKKFPGKSTPGRNTDRKEKKFLDQGEEKCVKFDRFFWSWDNTNLKRLCEAFFRGEVVVVQNEGPTSLFAR